MMDEPYFTCDQCGSRVTEREAVDATPHHPGVDGTRVLLQRPQPCCHHPEQGAFYPMRRVTP